jgi:hypothetical protein
MNLTYVPTIKDYRAGLRLHYRQKLTRRIVHFLGLWMLPLFILLMSTPTIYDKLTQPEEHLGGFGWLTIAVASSFMVPLLQYYGVKKQFNRAFPLQQTVGGISIEVNNDRIVFTIPGISVGTYYWTGITESAQDERITLLYTGKNRFMMFPTQALSADQRTELNDLVTRHVTARKPC